MIAVAMMATLLGSGARAQCDVLKPWTDWQVFQDDLIMREGRVVDFSDERKITTSEGQSYALFFALVNNDRKLFRRLLRWTERHLAKGDLTARLPAWLWGHDPEGNWTVLDNNTASDSNLWIAYTLLEAGRLWQEHSYTALGTMMLQRIAKEEIARVPGVGLALLPGRDGFVVGDAVRLNPSYMPPQILARVRHDFPESVWSELLDSTIDFLLASSPLGLAPDWVDMYQGKLQRTRAGRIGSYNAIRVYLWVGMLHPDAVGADRLIPHFRQAQAHLNVRGGPAEKIDIFDGSATTRGPIGFSAAVLPLFAASQFGAKQRARLTSDAIKQAGYYSRVLSLFGTAWDQQRYRFDAHGYLIPAWRECP